MIIGRAEIGKSDAVIACRSTAAAVSRSRAVPRTSSRGVHHPGIESGVRRTGGPGGLTALLPASHIGTEGEKQRRHWPPGI